MERAELSVRSKPVGPPLAEQVKVTPAAAMPIGHSAILILIHGYNNSYADAKVAYDIFRKSLNSNAGLPLAIPIYDFFWPGDEVLKIYSTLSFAGKIDVSVKAAEVLCSYFEQMHGPGGGPIDVHFVAHSLGNRLLLALLSSAARFPSVIVRSITLMAAAVPVEMVAYGNSLYQACLVASFSQTLHSRSDDVLHWAFPAGETLNGEAFFPVAVGRFGQPAGNWRTAHSFDTFAHGDYWTHSGPPSLVLAQLGIGAPRETSSSGIASRQTAVRSV